MSILKIQNLSKRYGERQLFQGLNREFTAGCYALSEEDNSGKTTLLNIVAGVLKPDSGDVLVEGHSVFKAGSKAKSHMAFVPDNCMGFPDLSGRELLHRLAQDKKVQVSNAVFDFAHALGLEPHLDKRFDQMSTGTRRKVYLAATLIGQPSVIIADCPTNGLDSAARGVLAEYFQEMGQEKVVLFASWDADLISACGAEELAVSTLTRSP